MEEEKKEEKTEVVVEDKSQNVEFEKPAKITIPEEYKPIGMWGYFGYQLLFAIPCIGLIVAIVFALGGQRNINVRNFARSYFCWLIIGVVLAVILAIVGVSFAGILGGLTFSR